MDEPDLLKASLVRFADLDREFTYFQEKAPALIRAAFERHPRFGAIKKLFNGAFYVIVDGDFAVQAWFGRRRMGRKDLEGKDAIEEGLALHYSKGPTGSIVVSLYPCKSSLVRTHEGQIHVRKGDYSALRLIHGIPSDVDDLLAYAHVSSVAGQPTWRERFRIQWLRWSRPMQVDGGYAEQATLQVARFGWNEAVKALFVFVLGALSALVLVRILDASGLSALADLIRFK